MFICTNSNSLMLDVVIRGTFQVGDHMRRDAVNGGDLGPWELSVAMNCASSGKMEIRS